MSALDPINLLIQEFYPAGRVSPITMPYFKSSKKLTSVDATAGRLEPSDKIISQTKGRFVKSTQNVLSSNRNNFLREFAINNKQLKSSPNTILPKYYKVVRMLECL